MRIRGIWVMGLLLVALACDDREEDAVRGAAGENAGDTGDGGGMGSSGQGSDGESGLEGRCQKGPFVRGSTVTIQLLDGGLIPTGKQFTVLTENDFGEFRVRSAVGDEPLELFVSGFFFDETAGKSSAAPISLRSLTASKNAGVNVNVLTHLQSFRVASLVEAGTPVEDAFEMARKEVLASFGIPAASVPAFGAMNLIAAGDGNASLLAVSALLTQAAKARGTEAEAALTELLSELSDDLADNGTVDSAELSAELQAAARSLDIPAVRDHLDAWFATHDVGSARPTFEKFVDIDGDGLIADEDEDSDSDGLVDAEDPDAFVHEPAWVDSEAMLTGRRKPAACTWDSKLFVFGGLDAPTSAEVYDPANAKWTPRAELPANMSQAGCATIGDFIYVFGRFGTFAYEPATDTYQARAIMPSPRDRFATVVVGDDAYIIGGYTIVEHPLLEGTYSDQVHVYSPATDDWSSRAPLPIPLGELVAVPLDDKIYALGGNFGGSNKKSFVYDVSTDAWSEMPLMQRPSWGGTAAVLDGFVYFLGGNLFGIDAPDEREELMNVERYEPARGEWVSASAIRKKQSEASAVVLNGSIFVLGDWRSGGSAGTVSIYRPQFDTF
jgi:hypothetical protein